MNMTDTKAQTAYKKIVISMALLLLTMAVAILVGSLLMWGLYVNVNGQAGTLTGPGLEKLGGMLDQDPELSAAMLCFMFFAAMLGGVYWVVVCGLAVLIVWGLIVYNDRMPSWWRQPMQRALDAMEKKQGGQEIASEVVQNADR
jgi:hypothetical protein